MRNSPLAFQRKHVSMRPCLREVRIHERQRKPIWQWNVWTEHANRVSWGLAPASPVGLSQ